jgi:hypothetical protein
MEGSCSEAVFALPASRNDQLSPSPARTSASKKGNAQTSRALGRRPVGGVSKRPSIDVYIGIATAATCACAPAARNGPRTCSLGRLSSVR